MKRLISALMVFILLISVPVYADNEESKSEKAKSGVLAPNSEAAVVIDMTSDYILFEKDMNKKMFPASLTKLMTAILTVENKSMEDTTVVSESAVADINKYESSNVDLDPGDVLTVDELMHALLIPSANDAANVLAEFVGGSREEFVKLMNEKAKELGCKNTNFVNANGLHDDNHYTTAYDMALIAKAAMEKPEIASIVSQWSFVMNNSGYTYASTNHLVSRYVYLDYYYVNATGIKTGYTDEAQRTLASSASDGEHQIIAVVMGCPDNDDGSFTSFVDAKQLLSHFLENNSNKVYISANQIIGEEKVKNAKGDGRLLMITPVTKEAYLPNETTDSDITYKIKLKSQQLVAPIEKNQLLGYADVLYKGDKISTIELRSDREIKKSYIKAFFNAIGGFTLLKIVICILVVLIAIMIIIRQRNLYLRKKRRAEKLRELRLREEAERNDFRNRNNF